MRSSQPQGPEQKYHVSALQVGRVVPIKGNVVTRGLNMQDRPEECILCNPLVSEIQEVFKIPVERPSTRVFFPWLRAFFSSSGSYKAIKSPYFSLEKAQCKNNNLRQRHATNDIFIRGLVDGKRCTDIHTSTLRVSDQYQKFVTRANIGFRISRG